MQSFMVSLLGLVLSVSVGAEPLLKGRVWLASGPPAAGVQVRLFDLTDLRRSVGTTTDEAGHFALRLQAFSTDRRTALPQDFALGQNYPNPFNPSTIIPYQIPTTTHVRLEVFNLLGQRLATLVDGERPAGAHTAQWDATDATGRAVGAGVFIYRLTGGGHTVSRRMVLIDGQAGIPAGAAGPRQTAALERTGAEGAVYGLTVAGTGLIAYVDPAFRVGTDPVDVVLEQPGGKARMKVATGGILGDVNNDSQVDEFDVLYVALYSKDPSITLPNHGDISLGDVNGDGTVDLADGLLLALYKVNPSDPTLPPGIGQPVDGSGDDHGDTPSSATALAVGSSRSGQLETGGDVDYFRVQVAASGELTVHTTGSLDTRGQLEDSAGGVLARDDDGGDGFNFRLAHTVSAGTYYIKVEGYDATTTGRYTIHASGPGGGGSGPDLIVASASVSDNTLTPGQSFTLNATVRNQGTAAAAATTVHYYQSPDATITADDAPVGTDPVSGLSADQTSAVSIDLTAPSSAGTYYYGACVQSVSGESNTDNNCSAGVSVTVGRGSGDDHGDTPSSATALAVGSSQSGQLETGGDVDYFRVEVSASGDLTVHTTGSLDTRGQLEDSAGGVLARDDDGGDGYNFRIAHAVSAGTYYIKVEGYDATTTGSYTIHASGPGGGGGDDGTVNIVDANLRAVIAEALGKAPNAPITPDEMATLTILGAANKGIRNLAGLEFATNLTRLDLGVERVDGRLVNSNDISNLSPLSGLTDLTRLWLEANSITDVSPLSDLTDLTFLYLYANSITDVSPLSGLTRLEILSLSTNSITDISPLSGLTDLTRLWLYANNIADVSPLSDLTRLEILNLSANNIADVSPLSGLTQLEEMNLKSNIITDVSPLSGLTNLTWLDLRGNPLSVSSINVHIAALVSRGTTVHFESFRPSDFDIELVYLDPFTEYQKRVVEYAARRWMSIITRDLPDVRLAQSFLNIECGDRSYDVFRGERIDDLRMYVSFLSNEAPDGVVGLGGPDITLRPSRRPITACIELNPRQSMTTFRELVLHEMAHALGMVTAFWQDKGFYQARFSDPHFNGPRAIAAFNSAGGRNYAGPKVPAQIIGRGAHWRSFVFLDELMVPYISFGRLSAITIQSLADLSLGYSVDVTQADPYILPRARAAQTSADIASNDSWDDLLKEGLGLYTQAEPHLLCGVGIVEEQEPLYLEEQEAIIILGD